jgi:hypothetical protein
MVVDPMIVQMSNVSRWELRELGYEWTHSASPPFCGGLR